MKRHLTKIVVLLIICFLVVSASADPSSQNPDMTITKTANVTSVSPGDVFTYNLGVHNLSGYGAHNVRIIDGLPAGLILQSWDVPYKTSDLYDVLYLGSGTWIPLDSGLNPTTYYPGFGDLFLDITVQLDPLYTGDEIINTAQVTSLDEDINISNNESTLVLPVVIPAPGAIVLGSIGVSFVAWLKKRRTL